MGLVNQSFLGSIDGFALLKAWIFEDKADKIQRAVLHYDLISESKRRLSWIFLQKSQLGSKLLCLGLTDGSVAQLVEQRTFNA